MNTYTAAFALAAAALLMVLAVVLYKYDKQKARFLATREAMRIYMLKAENDRNDKVRIPSEQVQEMFDLGDTRAVPKWKLPSRAHRHPATLSPARRSGL